MLFLEVFSRSENGFWSGKQEIETTQSDSFGDKKPFLGVHAIMFRIKANATVSLPVPNIQLACFKLLIG